MGQDEGLGGGGGEGGKRMYILGISGGCWRQP